MNTGTAAVTGALLVAALAGCSSAHVPTVASSAVPKMGPAAPTATAMTNGSPGQAQVIIGGKDASPSGSADCWTGSGQTTITIGDGTNGATVVLTDQTAPAVKSVGIANLGGVSLGYVEGQPGNPPNATRNGNSYTITGSGTGTDTADPSKLVNTTYEISATCP
jgi:lipoprotein LpqH